MFLNGGNVVSGYFFMEYSIHVRFLVLENGGYGVIIGLGVQSSPCLAINWGFAEYWLIGTLMAKCEDVPRCHCTKKTEWRIMLRTLKLTVILLLFMALPWDLDVSEKCKYSDMSKTHTCILNFFHKFWLMILVKLENVS